MENNFCNIKCIKTDSKLSGKYIYPKLNEETKIKLFEYSDPKLSSDCDKFLNEILLSYEKEKREKENFKEKLKKTEDVIEDESSNSILDKPKENNEENIKKIKGKYITPKLDEETKNKLFDYPDRNLSKICDKFLEDICNSYNKKKDEDNHVKALKMDLISKNNEDNTQNKNDDKINEVNSINKNESHQIVEGLKKLKEDKQKNKEDKIKNKEDKNKQKNNEDKNKNKEDKNINKEDKNKNKEDKNEIFEIKEENESDELGSNDNDEKSKKNKNGKKLDFDFDIPKTEEDNINYYVPSTENKDKKTNKNFADNCSDFVDNVFDDYRKNKINKHSEYLMENKPELNAKMNEWIRTNIDKIIKIQSSWKSFFDRIKFLIIKSKVFIIQRCFRKYLIKKYNVSDNFFFNDKYLRIQNDILYENINQNYKILFPALFLDKSNPKKYVCNLLDKNLTLSYPKSPFVQSKLFLFQKILDLDLMIPTDEIYNNLWASTYNEINTKNIKKATPLQSIALGGEHTLLINSKGKIFSFGWNNYGQCGVPLSSTLSSKTGNDYNNLITITKYNELKPKTINCVEGYTIPEINEPLEGISMACGDDHSLILDKNGKVWTFGLNLNGQLGLGHNNIINTPTIIKSLSNEKIIDIKTEGNINFALSIKGEPYMWPWVSESGNHYEPRKIFMKPIKEKFCSISCGNKFVMFLSESGLVYSMGNSNKYGELGHGDFNKRLYPTVIEFFKTNNEKIVQISCGYKHVVAKTSLGKAFTWGYGGKGQLGLNSFNNFSIPRNVTMEDKFCKVYQVAAGFRSTFFLCENRKIYTCGYNGTHTMEKTPIVFDLIDKFPEISLEENLSVVKIKTTWNKSFSILYAHIADYSTLTCSKPKINALLNSMAANWDYESINPPYIEALEKYLCSGTMKHKVKIESHPKPKSNLEKELKDKDDKIKSNLIKNKKTKEIAKKTYVGKTSATTKKTAK